MAHTREKLDVELGVPGTDQVDLEAGTYDVVAIGDGLIRSFDRDHASGSLVTTTNFREPTVTITSADGTPVTLRPPRVNARVAINNSDLVSTNSFEVTNAGTYAVEVTGEPGAVTSVGVGQNSELDDAALAVAVSGGVMFGIGLLVTVIGIFLLIGGAVWRVVARSDQPVQPPEAPPFPGWEPPSNPIS